MLFFRRWIRLLGLHLLLWFSQRTINLGRDISKRIQHRRPDNWRQIADYYKIYRNISATIKEFNLESYTAVDAVTKRHMYWVTTILRWAKDLDSTTETMELGRKPVYGEKIDKQLVKVVQSYNDHAVPMTNMILRIQLITLLQSNGRTDILPGSYN